MEITHAKESEISIITISGRLDAATAPVAENIIKPILEGDCLRVLFDFSKLDYLGSGGLRVILGAAKALKRKGGQIVLCSLPNLVKEIFEVSGFNSVVPLAESVESGFEQLGVNPVLAFARSGVEGVKVQGFSLRRAQPSRVQGSAPPLAA